MYRFQHSVLASRGVSTRTVQRLGMSVRYGSSTGTSTGAAAAAAASSASPVAAETVLPGVDLAKRVAGGSQAFPASWSADEPLPPTDPRIVWRELYSLAEERPYYHNTQTNETTHDIPDGFVTRFPQLYRRAGYTIDERGAVFRGAGAAPVSGNPAGAAVEGAASPTGEAEAPKKLSTRQRLAALGGGGLLWYLIVHNICLATIFSMLYFFKVDLVSIAQSYGFNVKMKPGQPAVDGQGVVKSHPPFFKTFILAIVLNKLIVPLQMVFTLATAPFLVHRLEPVAVVLIPRMKAFFVRVKAKITNSGAAATA